MAIRAGQLLAAVAAGAALSACGGAAIAADPGCTSDWPHRTAVTGPLSSEIVGCADAARNEIRFTNTGTVPIGMQVASGNPVFEDPSPVSARELTIYEAVIGVVPIDSSNGETRGRVHVLLASRSVVVITDGAPYEITFSRGTAEIAAAYAAQTIGNWIYSHALPTRALIDDAAQCASGLGRAYSNATVPGQQVDISGVIQQDFPNVEPCAQTLWQARSLVTSGNASAGTAATETLPATDDAPVGAHAPIAPALLPEAENLPSAGPLGLPRLDDLSKLADQGFAADLEEAAAVLTTVR